MGNGAVGEVGESYQAAIQHDLVDFDDDRHLVGVVRRPTPWFHATVDENHRELGPPETLLDETKARQEVIKSQGMAVEDTLAAAWEAVNFAERYREYLANSDEAAATITALADRVRDGEDVVLVCYESPEKRCHRHLLVDLVADRV